MKTRNGFVSNSSSSSFIICKNLLTEWQIEAIKNHTSSDEYNRWYISEDDIYIYGSTSMDNFDMREFLCMIGINPNVVKWDD